MTNLTITTSVNPVPALQLTAKELEKEARNAAIDTARRLQTVGRANLKTIAKIPSSSTIRRVRQYGAKVWFGTSPVVEAPPSLEYVKYTRTHRGVVIDGKAVKYGFALTSGRWKNLPFQNYQNGRLRVLRRDITDAVRDAWVETSGEVEEIYQKQMDLRAERVVRRRK